jgi:hypothetical protein
MAAKAWGSQQKTVEEVFFQNEAVSLCLLINRRAKTMRVIDFRAGPSNAKRLFVLSLAQREGVEKVYTLVERDEVATWVKLGFTKEGNIPGFYKRSDAFLLGCCVPSPQANGSKRPVAKSEIRIVAATPAERELGMGPQEQAPLNPALELMERTVVLAKRHAKDFVDKPLPQAKVAVIREAEAQKKAQSALKAGRALTAFEPFGRDVERTYYAVTTRGGYELIASIESQACFGNAYLELLTGPRTEAERPPHLGCLRAICERLYEGGVVSCFSLGPSDDVALATSFVFNGFRRTGLLVNHLAVGTERKDATIWSRKLANPADE